MSAAALAAAGVVRSSLDLDLLTLDERVLARDLVLLKLYAGGTQDLWDIRQLLALPTRLKREVALKVLPADVAGDRELVEGEDLAERLKRCRSPSRPPTETTLDASRIRIAGGVLRADPVVTQFEDKFVQPQGVTHTT